MESLKRLFLQSIKTPLGQWNITNYKETTLKIKYAVYLKQNEKLYDGL